MFQTKKSWFRRHWILTTVLVLFAIGVVASFGEEDNEENTKIINDSETDSEITIKEETNNNSLTEQTLQVSYEELFRNSEKYIGENVYYKGEVIQVLGSTGDWTMLIAVTKKSDQYWDDNVLVYYSGTERYLEEDLVEFTGIFSQIYEYESALGVPIQVPLIYTENITLLSSTPSSNEDLEITDLNCYYNSYDWSIASGSVKNNGTATVDYVKVYVNFLKEDGTVINGDYTYVTGESIPSGQERRFELTITDPFLWTDCEAYTELS